MNVRSASAGYMSGDRYMLVDLNAASLRPQACFLLKQPHVLIYRGHLQLVGSRAWGDGESLDDTVEFILIIFTSKWT